MTFHGEGGIDRLLRIVFFPDKSYKGVFIEVGAADPTYLSISKHFRDSGWRVLSVEPNPYFAESHRAIGNNVLEYACGERDEDDIDFEMAKPKILGSKGKITYESFSAIRVKEEYKKNDPQFFTEMDVEKIKVKMRRLDTLLRETSIKFIDILSVDVEGWELEVLAGLNFDIYAPKLLVVENWLRDINYEKVISGYGYHFVCRNYPNDIYVRVGAYSTFRTRMAKFFNVVQNRFS